LHDVTCGGVAFYLPESISWKETLEIGNPAQIFSENGAIDIHYKGANIPMVSYVIFINNNTYRFKL
jgi:hypothetical protein